MHVEEGFGEFVIKCTREELDMLENGLWWFVSECEVGRPDPAIDLAKQMISIIANMEACNA